MISALLADLIAALHLGIVLFVLGGQVAILVGIGRGWHWIERLGFRWTHVGLMVFIAAQGVVGQICPLTIWEYKLRQAAGQAGHEGTFVGRLLHNLLFLEEDTVSQDTLVRYYVAFAGLVLLCLWAVPPRGRSRRERRGGTSAAEPAP